MGTCFKIFLFAFSIISCNKNTSEPIKLIEKDFSKSLISKNLEVCDVPEDDYPFIGVIVVHNVFNDTILLQKSSYECKSEYNPAPYQYYIFDQNKLIPLGKSTGQKYDLNFDTLAPHEKREYFTYFSYNYRSNEKCTKYFYPYFISEKKHYMSRCILNFEIMICFDEETNSIYQLNNFQTFVKN